MLYVFFKYEVFQSQYASPLRRRPPDKLLCTERPFPVFNMCLTQSLCWKTKLSLLTLANLLGSRSLQLCGFSLPALNLGFSSTQLSPDMGDPPDRAGQCDREYIQMIVASNAVLPAVLSRTPMSRV
ncbi:uncharacterized protein LOC144293647 isoform X2 [Canis aureus]